MTSKRCCLRQHIRGESANAAFLYLTLSLDDNIISYLLHGPNLLDSHIEENIHLYDIEETRPGSGSLAILRWMQSFHTAVLKLTVPSDTQNRFAFLQALSDDVSVESLGHSFDGVSAHTGMRVRPSTNGSLPSTLQLLPGQSFYIGKTTLSLVPEEHSDLPIQSSGLIDSSLESYNHQVSQISTTQRAAKISPTVMETPMPDSDHDFEKSTPILEQITGRAILGRKDSKKWPESPLKREVMRTVRDASEFDHSSSQPEFKKEIGHIADAVMHEPSRSNPQPELRTEDKDMANATTAKPLGEDVLDLEDPEMADLDFGSEHHENSEPLSPKSRVHQEGGHEGSEESEPLSLPGVPMCPEKESQNPSNSPKLGGLERLPSSVVQVQPERRPETSDQSPSLQVDSDSSPESDDDLDDTPIRKRAKLTMASPELLVEESQDSLQNEVISVKRKISTPTDRPVSTYQASSTSTDASINTESGLSSARLLKKGCPTPLVGSKLFSSTIGSDSRPKPANRPPSGSSFTSAGTKPQTPLSSWNTVSASPSESVELNSSMRSTRSTVQDEHSSSSSRDVGIRVVFASSSSAGDSTPFLKFLSSKGVKKVKSVRDCTVLCVGKELKKTSKVITAVLLGKDIVTDRWVTDSVKGNDLLSLVPYMARDPEKEAEWGISLDKAIYRGKTGLQILKDYDITFTPSAKKELGKNGFDELKEIVKYAGAKGVSSGLPKEGPEKTTSTVVVGTRDGAEMAELQKLGWKAFAKDIISLSILRGKLDLESDEFLIREQVKGSRKRKR